MVAAVGRCEPSVVDVWSVSIAVLSEDGPASELECSVATVEC